MMKCLIFILFIAAASLLVGGCKKPSSCASSGGGISGTGTLSVTPTHLNLYVDSCIVYIKYGTLDAPANGVYDDSQWCRLYAPDTIPVAVFSNLQSGLYYLYAKGYHPAYQAYVLGAVNYTMCNEHAVSIYLPTYQAPPGPFIW